MAALEPTPLSGDSRKEIPVAKPRWAFFKGMLAGTAIEVPVIALAVWMLARFGVGDPSLGYLRIMRLTAVFAGIPALLTAGGIGRLAAYSFVDGGRRRALFAAARAHAVASAGLVLIAAIPHGHLPARYAALWLAYPAAGILVGAACGALIAVVCTSTTPVGLADVWSIARQPTRALRQLLDPDDLVRLGTALRNRTTAMFEGIFEPAPPPPKPAEPPAPEPKPVEPPAEPAKPGSRD
jgi:hypothetical protein